MKQAEIIEKLKQGYFINKKLIGYDSYIFLYRKEDIVMNNWVAKLSEKQLESLKSKNILDMVDNSDGRFLSGIGGRNIFCYSYRYTFRF